MKSNNAKTNNTTLGGQKWKTQKLSKRQKKPKQPYAKK
jgi:hypothetical protein